MDNNQMYQQDQTYYSNENYQAPQAPQVPPTSQQVPPQQPYGYGQQYERDETVSVGDWLVSMIIMMIPCVNIIMMFVWAFGSTEKKSKANYFKACLIIYGILFLIGIVMSILSGLGTLAALAELGKITNQMYY